MFGSGGAVLLLAAAALWAAVDAARLRAWRRCCLAAAAGAGLATLAGGFLWLGALNPGFNFRGNQGFPADWSCLTLGRGAAQVCGRDSAPRPTDPQRLQGGPPGRS